MQFDCKLYAHVKWSCNFTISTGQILFHISQLLVLFMLCNLMALEVFPYLSRPKRSLNMKTTCRDFWSSPIDHGEKSNFGMSTTCGTENIQNQKSHTMWHLYRSCKLPTEYSMTKSQSWKQS